MVLRLAGVPAVLEFGVYPPELDPQRMHAHCWVTVDGVAVADVAELKGKLQSASAQATQPEVHVRPDKAAKYDRFADVMVAVELNARSCSARSRRPTDTTRSRPHFARRPDR